MTSISEPKRWLESEEDALAEALRPSLRARQALGPTQVEHARMWRELAESLPPVTETGTPPAQHISNAVSATPRIGAAEPVREAVRAWRCAGLGAGVLVTLIAVWMWHDRAAQRARDHAAARATSTAAENGLVQLPLPAATTSQSSSRAQASEPSQAGTSANPLPPMAASTAEQAEVSRGSIVTPTPRVPRRTVRMLGAGGSYTGSAARVRDQLRSIRPRSSHPAAMHLPDSASGDHAGELDLLSRARRVVASDPARALELTAQHGQRYRDGVLAQEREVLAIEALRRLGHRSLAVSRARRFVLEHPGSAHRVRVLEEP